MSQPAPGASEFHAVLLAMRKGATLRGARRSLPAKTQYVLSTPRGHATDRRDVTTSVVRRLIIEGFLDMRGAKQSALDGTLGYDIPLTDAGLAEANYRATP